MRNCNLIFMFMFMLFLWLTLLVYSRFGKWTILTLYHFSFINLVLLTIYLIILLCKNLLWGGKCSLPQGVSHWGLTWDCWWKILNVTVCLQEKYSVFSWQLPLKRALNSQLLILNSSFIKLMLMLLLHTHCLFSEVFFFRFVTSTTKCSFVY